MPLRSENENTSRVHYGGYAFGSVLALRKSTGWVNSTAAQRTRNIGDGYGERKVGVDGQEEHGWIPNL